MDFFGAWHFDVLSLCYLSYLSISQFKFLSVVLGGYFGSRLMSNIREDKGLTYGIGSICIHQEESGYFSISTEVKGEGTKLALKEIYYELRRLREELISCLEK